MYVEKVQKNMLKKIDAKKDPVQLVGWIVNLPSQNLEYQISLIKCAITQSLQDALQEHCEAWSFLDLWVKPIRQAVANAKITKGKLVLFAIPKQIDHSITKKKEQLSEDTVYLGQKILCAKTVFFYAKPAFTDPNKIDDKKDNKCDSKQGFVTPFSFLQRVQQDEDVNLVPHTLKAKPFDIPCFINRIKIEEGSILKILRVKREVTKAADEKPSKKSKTS